MLQSVVDVHFLVVDRQRTGSDTALLHKIKWNVNWVGEQGKTKKNRAMKPRPLDSSTLRDANRRPISR